jgi:predicted lipoprotein with Yx(FWY)xxD motif/plastocyanin
MKRWSLTAPARPGTGRVRIALFGAVVLMLVLAGCVTLPAAPATEPPAAESPAPQPTATEPPATEPPAAEPAATEPPTTAATPTPEAATDESAAVTVVTDDELGEFLADEEGMTLYLFLRDTENMSNCYEQCAQAWPPLLTEGAPNAGEGVNDALLGTTERTDGTTQVTYNGRPLYYFARDEQPGDANGQGLNDVWFVISPEGEQIGGEEMPAATPEAAAAETVVSIRNFAFNPRELTVPVGTTVVWQNEDTDVHTVTADDGAFDSGNMANGAEFSFTFTQAGTYPYYCAPHGAPGGQGMAGTIIVQ